MADIPLSDMPLSRMTDELWIVTGATRGLGEALCRVLLSLGHTVCGCARGENRGLAEYGEGSSGSYLEVKLDLGDPESVDGAVAALKSYPAFRECATVCLINNAGVIAPVGPVGTLTSAETYHHMATNLAGPMSLTALLLEAAAERSRKMTVVNISSGAGRSPYYGRAAYCAGKAGIEMFTRVLAHEQDEEGGSVRAYAVRPGAVDTSMQAYSRELPDEATRQREKFIQLKNEGKLLPPEKAAQLVLRTREDSRVEPGSTVDVRELYPEQL